MAIYEINSNGGESENNIRPTKRNLERETTKLIQKITSKEIENFKLEMIKTGLYDRGGIDSLGEDKIKEMVIYYNNLNYENGVNNGETATFDTPGMGNLKMVLSDIFLQRNSKRESRKFD